MNKKYILIQNDGEIETNSFELIGASTKRGETGKIGFFGSGLKYSIAYMMRNKIDFKVYSGEQELIFTTIPEVLKDQSFDRICINGKPTSYTVTMGPTWTEDWFVLREIYCNALDESNCQLIRETEHINPVEGKTRIYISLTEKLADVVNNWDAYFAADRVPVVEMEAVYTSYLGNTDIGGKNRQTVKVFQKINGTIYRKGVKVGENKKMEYDYCFDYVDINEDRTAKHLSALDYTHSNLMAKFCSEQYVKTILRTGADDHPCDEYSSITTNKPDDKFNVDAWVKFTQDNTIIVKEISARYSEEANRSTKEVFYIPVYFARELKKQVPDVQVFGMGRAIGEVGMSDVDMSPKMNYLLKEVLTALKEMNYDVPYPITVVRFDKDSVLGQADMDDKHIYLSDKLFDMGRREIAMTIMEETEHIISQKEDETRAFQTHIFSQWLKSMENSNGLFL